MKYLQIACVILVGGCLTSAAIGQATESAPTVADVRVSGNVHMSDGAVLSYIRIHAGDFFDESVIGADVQRLLATGRFTSVNAQVVQTPQGPVITFAVVERPVVARLEIRGNDRIKEGMLVKELAFSEGSPFTIQAVQAGREALIAKYRAEGYYFVTVEVDQDTLAQNEVLYNIVEGPLVRTRKIRFRGNTHFANIKLKFSVASGTRIWPFTKGFLDDKQVEQDIQTIRTMYIEDGFLEVQVGAQREFSPDRKNVKLIFVIDEGPRFRVNQVSFVGNTIFGDSELARRITLGQGEYYTSLALRRDLEQLRNTYGELGFINAAVASSRTFLDPTTSPHQADDDQDPALLNVTFEIHEGLQYHVGQVLIRGNTTTYDNVIRRELRFHPGQLYNTVAVDESRHRLRETRLFEEVSIAPVGGDDQTRDALVTVSEGQTAQFLVGFGVSSKDGLVGNVAFTQRNFDLFGWPRPGRTGPAFKGAGQTLSVRAEPGLDIMRFSVDWYEPSLFDQPYSLGVRGFIFNRERESYDETRMGPVVSLGHLFKNRWYAELSTRLEGVEINKLDKTAPVEVFDVRGTNLLVGLKGTVARNRTDSRWLPSTGDNLRLSYEQVTGDHNFGIATVDYQRHYTVWMDALDRKHIISLRGSIGNIFGDAPVFERFYAGGIGSVRGFEYRGISPRSGVKDDPIGGDFMLYAGVEYTFPLVTDVLRGVVFLDSGTVERNFGIDDYRVSAGFGLRWVIPFFGPIPMSLDFGFPLNPKDEDDRQLVSFSLGWTF